MGGAELQLIVKARDEASSALGNIGKAAVGLGVAFAGAALVAVKAAAQEEVGMKQLAQAARNAGVDWDRLGGATEKQIKAWQDMSGVADTEMRPAFAFLIAQTGSLEEATKRMPLALDLSRGANIDLAAASKLLGKLTDENVNVFKKMGLTFDKNATELDVLAAVQQKFGGQSKEFAATAAGAMQGLQNEIGDVVEEIGFALLPMFKTAIDGIRGFLAAFSEGGGLAGVKDAFKAVVDITGELFGVLTGSAPDAGAALTRALGPETASTIMSAVATVREGFKAAFTFLQETVFPPLMQAFKFLGDNWASTSFAIKVVALTVLVPAFAAWALAAGAAALATIIALAPVVLAVAAIGTAAFLLKEAWDNDFGGIQEKVQAVIGFITGIFDRFQSEGLGGLLRGVGEFRDSIVLKFFEVGAGIVHGIIDGLGGLKDAIWNALVAAFQSIDFWVGPFHISGTSGITVSMPSIQLPSFNLPSFANGGIVPGPIGAPQLVIAHGGEPIGRGAGAGSGGGGGTTVNVYVQNAYGLDDLNAKVASAVRDAVSRGGLRGITA